MLSTVFAVCLLAALSIVNVAAQVRPGVYKIYSAEAYSSLRAYSPHESIFTSVTKENPGPFELWEIRPAANQGGFTILNIGQKLFAHADANYDARVITDENPTTFAIDPAGDGVYAIKVVNRDLVWTLKDPIFPRGEVVLKGRTGQGTQLWRLQSLDYFSEFPAHVPSAKFKAQSSDVRISDGEGCAQAWSFFKG